MPTFVGYNIFSKDKTKLHFKIWDVAQPKICICIVHGLGEHSGRYEEWANMFGEKNIAVASFDFRGHGLSDGKRGHAFSFHKLYDDIDAFLTEVKRRFPLVPLVLYGHSLGGSLVLNYYMSGKSYHTSAIIVTSPWFKLVNEPSKFLIDFTMALSRFLPFITVSNRINPLLLSRDRQIAEEYTKDPLVHNKISLRLFHEAYRMGIKASKQAYKLNIPTLIMHGENDAITSSATSVEFARNTGPFLSLHDLCKKMVFQHILHWLQVNNLYREDNSPKNVVIQNYY
ncbi:MAG TPA: lysophospholipase [Bacteroidales bacterium]|nr:lysophospholipase [Bacteroidales bacterium]